MLFYISSLLGDYHSQNTPKRPFKIHGILYSFLSFTVEINLELNHFCKKIKIKIENNQTQ